MPLSSGRIEINSCRKVYGIRDLVLGGLPWGGCAVGREGGSSTTTAREGETGR